MVVAWLGHSLYDIFGPIGEGTQFSLWAFLLQLLQGRVSVLGLICWAQVVVDPRPVVHSSYVHDLPSSLSMLF